VFQSLPVGLERMTIVLTFEVIKSRLIGQAIFGFPFFDNTQSLRYILIVKNVPKSKRFFDNPSCRHSDIGNIMMESGLNLLNAANVTKQDLAAIFSRQKGRTE
jgi:hypothetical protein